MTTSNEDRGHSFFGSKLHIEAIQSVMPTKPTDPRRSYRVQVPGTPNPAIFHRRFQTIISYKSDVEEENPGWIMAGWIKESLGKALAEEPVFAGRLRRGEGEGGEELEVVTNDSGARLVEASVEMELAEFLDLEEKKEVEGELVFWDNVNEDNPQFFPLLYVQVTNFKCGGYSIGISCSLFLADVFSILSFLKKWSEIHKNIVSSSSNPKAPLFYLPKLRQTGSYPSMPIDHNTRAKAGHSMFFTTEAKILNLEDDKTFKNLATQCINEAEQRLGRKIESETLLYVKGKSGNIKIENFVRDGEDQKPFISNVNGLSYIDGWENFGAGQNMYFTEGNIQAHVSYLINSVSDEIFVMIIPSYEDYSRVHVLVTIPS
ncbi:acetyltransferase [Lithospermum erythrorhizon]|uniref:Acetyltransferase n=1 Tax=Lithospermum erythrorhizon TaxID=34254 RepID=A0AAV3Q948_LITER